MEKAVMLEAPSLECEAVTVFRDRAEVRRLARPTLTVGLNEIVVSQLPARIDPDSIRVQGTGPATIVEVQYQSRAEASEVSEASEKAQASILDKLRALEKAKAKLATKIERLLCQKDVYKGVAQQVSKGPSTFTKDATAELILGISSLSDLDAFVQNYDDKVAVIDGQITDIEEEQMRLGKDIGVLKEELRKTGQGGSGNAHTSRRVSILVDASEAGVVDLSLTYVVHGPSWAPSYDIRVLCGGETPSMQLTYYGKVTQSSGEDWAEAKLSLSTAKPHVGADIPRLPTLRVSLKPAPQPLFSGPLKPPVFGFGGGAGVRGGGGLFGGGGGGGQEQQPPAFGFGSSGTADAPPPPVLAPPPMPVTEAEVTATMLATSFEVRRPANIPSDGAAHKVTIGVVSLSPVLEYVCVGGKGDRAFLKATAINDSALALLAGPAAVYLDSDFISNSAVADVSPSEELSVSLGVDHGIRVDRKPLTRIRHESGMLSKSFVEERLQRVSLKNTRATPVQLVLFEQIPLATDEKVKVVLVAPALSREAGVALTKDNILRWAMVLPPAHERMLEIKYTVECPRKEILVYKEDAASSNSHNIFGERRVRVPSADSDL